MLQRRDRLHGGKDSMLRTLTSLIATVLIVSGSATAWGQGNAEATLSKDQMKQFLLTAKVLSGKQTSKGITNPWRLTMSDGTVTHDGAFQAIDEHKATMQFSDGHVELNFVDSYKYNVAAYGLAELLGLDDVVPVYVERKWNGRLGSLSWWLPVKMD